MQESQHAGIALTDLDPSEIACTFNLKPFQGRQIFQWIHRKQATGFESMTNLSKALRARLEARGLARQTTLEHAALSPKSGTRKVLVRLRDGESVEAVLLRDRNRVTLCLSAQVGCALECPFCATGQSGFKRNLTPGEIVEQALHLLAGEDLGERTPNIVYMGMGEPFRNYDAVAKSIRLLMDKDGLAIGARRITVSTVGETGGIRRFAGENWQVRLAVSLHAANDALRSKLVPLNRTHPLPELMKAIEYYTA
ncbi:MAG: radical SAM protein, partial [Nitrospiraceae bacterium]|nr:radical SAM protein [Nitrospiraceae bacterium]